MSQRIRAPRFSLLLALVCSVFLAPGCPEQRLEPVALELPEPATQKSAAGAERFQIDRERALTVVAGFMRALRKEDAETLFELVGTGTPLARELTPLKEVKTEAEARLHFAYWRARIWRNHGVMRGSRSGNTFAALTIPVEPATYHVRFDLDRNEDGQWSLGGITPKFDGFGRNAQETRRFEAEAWPKLPDRTAASAPPGEVETGAALAEELLAAVRDEPEQANDMLVSLSAYSRTFQRELTGQAYGRWRSQMREQLAKLAELAAESDYAGQYTVRAAHLPAAIEGETQAEEASVQRMQLALGMENERRRLVLATFGTEHTDSEQWWLLELQGLDRPISWPTAAGDWFE